VVTPDRAATTARRICCLLAVPASAHWRTVSRDRPRRTGNLQTGVSKFRCVCNGTFRRRSRGRGKPGVAGFRGPNRAHRGDDIRRSSGHTSKDIAKYLGVSRATLYRYLAEDNAAA